ncbi:MAG: nucleotidyl transferase AbiEii/AbiGii toxin family protein [Solirubrobacteraceae bacterium]
MRYTSAEALRDALEARLGERASEGQSITRLRKQVAFERLLCRLQLLAPDRWLLKGGFALQLRIAERARTTKDIDLDWSIAEEAATSALIDAAQLDLDDYFEFRLERVELDADIGGRGQRWRATARLAGRTFEQVLVDVGHSIEPLLDPEQLPLPSALGFAGFEQVSVPAAALEQHLAEKLHAYTRRYAGDRPSSRAKDLIDIVLIAGIAEISAQRLDDAIERLFAIRDTHARPSELPRPPRSWARPYASLADDVGLPRDLDSAYAAAVALLNPVLAGTAKGQWDPGLARWGR